MEPLVLHFVVRLSEEDNRMVKAMDKLHDSVSKVIKTV
jgi:hypothetical protein